MFCTTLADRIEQRAWTLLGRVQHVFLTVLFPLSAIIFLALIARSIIVASLPIGAVFLLYIVLGRSQNRMITILQSWMYRNTFKNVFGGDPKKFRAQDRTNWFLQLTLQSLKVDVSYYRYNLANERVCISPAVDNAVFANQLLIEVAKLKGIADSERNRLWDMHDLLVKYGQMKPVPSRKLIDLHEEISMGVDFALS